MEKDKKLIDDFYREVFEVNNMVLKTEIIKKNLPDIDELIRMFINYIIELGYYVTVQWKETLTGKYVSIEIDPDDVLASKKDIPIDDYFKVLEKISFKIYKHEKGIK